VANQDDIVNSMLIHLSKRNNLKNAGEIAFGEKYVLSSWKGKTNQK